MGFAEKRGDYFRARFKIGSGKYGTVKDATGATVRFAKKRDAEKAANDEEAKIRAGNWKDPSAGRITLAEFAGRWYAGLDLAASTMQNYRRHLEEHILVEFGETALADILAADVDAWEKKERDAGYAASSAKTWRTTLHVLLEDAVEAGLISRNPAAKRRGKGKRAGRSQHRGPEKAVVGPLEALLAAERAALLSNRPDEFVLLTTKFYTGMRWGELLGLETKYARLGSIRVEHQLYELDTGEMVRCPPKEDSYRDIDLPPFLSKLISDHVTRAAPRPCLCHERTYVFSGGNAGGSSAATGPVTMQQVADRAEVSIATVSNVLNNPHRVAEARRTRVEAAIEELGYVRSVVAPARRAAAAHWRRSGFAAWVFTPAASGWFPPKAPQQARPVPVTSGPWPGVPVRGRNSQGRAEACWTAISKDLTPHSLRHSHKTAMAEYRTPEVLSHERLGHEMGGVAGRYTHVTPAMRQELLDRLTADWEAALDARWRLHPRSAVAVLDDLLRARRRRMEEEKNKIFSPDSPRTPEMQKARLSLVEENRA